MNKLYRFLFLVLLPLFFTNCLESNFDYQFPYQQKPVVVGFIDSLNGVRVFVGKNTAVTSTDSSFTKGAQVELWNQNGKIDDLTLNAEKLFTARPTVKFSNNDSFFLKIKHPLSIEPLESEKIRLSPSVPILSARYIFRTAQKDAVQLFIDIKDPDGFNAYSFFIQRFKGDTLFDVAINEETAFIPIYGSVISDREFQGKPYTHILESVNATQYINRRLIEMDRLRITLFNLPKPTFDFFQSIRTPEPGVGDPFFDPTIISNNIKNGIGIFATYGSFSFDVMIKR